MFSCVFDSGSGYQLVVEFGVGIAVLVRCFVDRKGMDHQITEKLGIGFSRPPFATVVVQFPKFFRCIYVPIDNFDHQI